MMPALYSYVVAHDNGAAPNPFWNACTLVICKPSIRRTAQVGDWIVGTGSASSSLGDLRGYVVYAMQVTAKMSMQEYDVYCRSSLPEKIPDWRARDPRRRVGDAIYDFDLKPPAVRPSVHSLNNRERDLSGKYALLSHHFFYFGDQPELLPPDLHSILAQRGHRVWRDRAKLHRFLEWLKSLGLSRNRLYGKPQGRIFRDWELPSSTVSC